MSLTFANQALKRHPAQILFDRLLDEPSFALQPQYHWHESEQGFTLSLDMPGVRRENVKMDLNDGVLNIAAERKIEHSETMVKFERNFQLPTSVDVEKIDATLEDGVLKLTLPKLAERQPRSIQIRAN